jgi:predicted XRE-type DNA-binding protein
MAISHETPIVSNIFADLGFPEAEAESLKARSTLMIEIHRSMEERGLSKKEAAALFGVTQPRITALKRGRIDEFTKDELIGMLAHVGIHVDVNVRSAE